MYWETFLPVLVKTNKNKQTNKNLDDMKPSVMVRNDDPEIITALFLIRCQKSYCDASDFALNVSYISSEVAQSTK